MRPGYADYRRGRRVIGRLLTNTVTLHRYNAHRNLFFLLQGLCGLGVTLAWNLAMCRYMVIQTRAALNEGNNLSDGLSSDRQKEQMKETQTLHWWEIGTTPYRPTCSPGPRVKLRQYLPHRLSRSTTGEAPAKGRQTSRRGIVGLRIPGEKETHSTVLRSPPSPWPIVAGMLEYTERTAYESPCATLSYDAW